MSISLFWYEHPLIFCKTKGKKRCPICMGFRNCDCIMRREKENNNKIDVDFLNDSDYYFICNHCEIEYSRKKDSFYYYDCDFYICMKCYKEHFFYIGRDIENKITISLDNEKVKPKLCKCYLDNENNQNNINCRTCLINLTIYIF